MSRFFPSFFLAIALFTCTRSIACGYGYIGDCSTGVHLGINGTVDSFEVANCPYLKSFDGLDLGSIQSLALVKATSITWESCANTVTGVKLFYNVHKTNEAPGNWLSFAMIQDYDIIAGAYDTRYHSKTGNVNLLSGLQVGQDYVLEVYFEAAVDTIGDDMIPETTLRQNNNGKNYKIRFRYDGPSAPPFTVVTTLVQPLKCNGDNSGRVGVSVYGNQSNLFYQWSNVNSNFFAQYNLPAGSYTVTVSGINGYTQARTILLPEPALISLSISQTPVTLNCAPLDTLETTLSAENNALHPSYFWYNNGVLVGNDSTFTTLINVGQNFISVTVKDANACMVTKAVTLEVIVNPPPVVYLTVQNCTSLLSNDGTLAALIIGGTGPYTIQWTNGAIDDYLSNLAPGNYCVTLTDANGCTSTNCATVSAPSAVQSPDENHILQIQPNPVMRGQEVQVQFQDSPSDHALELLVYHADGRLLLRQKRDGPSAPLRFTLEADTPSGVYWVVLRNIEKTIGSALFVH